MEVICGNERRESSQSAVQVHADSRLPQTEALDNLFYHLAFLDVGHEPHLIRIPAVIVDELKTLVRDVLDDDRDVSGSRDAISLGWSG